MPAPTIGRIVHYTLTDTDAFILTDMEGILNVAREGDVLPLIITKVHGGSSVNGQVMLDGNGFYWVQSVSEGPDLGQWQWPIIRP